jgi:DNA mismatch repair protein MSH5
MSSLPSSQRGVSSPHDHEEDALNEVIMAIEMKDNNTVGCAYYVTFEKTMYLQEDIPMAGVEVIETLLLQAQPTSVIINNRAPAKMADFLEAHAQDLDGSTGERWHTKCLF